MKKILLSGGVLVVAAALVMNATGAFFSDTKTVNGNTIAAATFDLSLKNDSNPGLTAFSFKGMLPGDEEDKVFRVKTDHDAWIKLDSKISDNGGHLKDKVEFDFYYSQDGLNWNLFEHLQTGNPDSSVVRDLKGVNLSEGSELVFASYFTKAWHNGARDIFSEDGYLVKDKVLWVKVVGRLSKDAGNEVQGKTATVNFTVSAEQARNNADGGSYGYWYAGN